MTTITTIITPTDEDPLATLLAQLQAAASAQPTQTEVVVPRAILDAIIQTLAFVQEEDAMITEQDGSLVADAQRWRVVRKALTTEPLSQVIVQLQQLKDSSVVLTPQLLDASIDFARNT